MYVAIAAILIGLFIAGQKAGVSLDDPTGWKRFDALFQRYASINNIPWTWLKAIALNESNLGRDPLVIAKEWSSDGKSRGLMQLTVPTANDYQPGITAEELDDDETSVRIAAQYVGYLYKRYSGDPQKVIMSYNQGQGNTDRGKTYALGYFQKWQNNLNSVEASL